MYGTAIYAESVLPKPEVVESLPSNVKQNVASFVPRQEITDKLKKTFAEHPKGSTIILTGQRGAGKTQIARYVCQEYEKDKAARLILELDAGNSTILLDEYKRLGDLLGLQLKDNEKPQDVQCRVKNALLKLKHPFIILFFDNAYDYATIAPYLCPSSNDKVLYSLVTSYNTAIWNGVPNVIPIRPPLQPEFTPKEAIIYIKNERNLPEVSNEDANQLAELLHYHPLALTQAVSYILQNSTIEEFCQKYKALPSKRLDEKLEGDYPESVVNVTDFALEKLSDSTKEILYACSLLHSKNIPKRLIEEALHPLLYQDSIQELQSFSLLTRSDDASGNTPVYYELHELTQEMVRYRLSSDKKARQIQLLDFFENKLENYTEILDSEEELREKEYLKQVFTHAQSFSKYLDISDLSTAQNEKYATLFSYIGNCFNWHADYNQAKEKHEQTLEIRVKIHGENHPDVASSLSSLANVLSILSQYGEAKEKHEQALKIRTKIYGNNHSVVATSLNNLANVLSALGQYEEAKETHEKALAIWKKIPDNHPDIARSLNNLGRTLKSLGRYQEAKEKQERALAIRIKIYGENHPDVATLLSNLGLVFASLGWYKEAREKHERALEIRVKTYGEEHPTVGTSLNNLGEVLSALGLYKEAKEKHERALEIRIKTYGNSHSAVAQSLNNLGSMLEFFEQYAEAKEKHEQALAIGIKTYGENHPDVATSLSNLGVVFQFLGQYSEAEIKYKKALEIRREIYGDNHLAIIQSLNHLGNIFRFIGRYSESKREFEQALTVGIKTYGENHPDIAESWNNMGELFAKKGKYEEAKIHYEKALAIRIATLGENHLDVAISFNNLGYVLEALKCYEEALKKHEAALKIYENIHGENHPSVAALLNDLRRVLQFLGRSEEAKAFSEQEKRVLSIQYALQERLEVIGPRQVDGVVLKDIEGNDNCFYRAVIEQMKQRQHPALQEEPKLRGAYSHRLLRQRFAPNVSDFSQIMQLAKEFNSIVAILDTRYTAHGFRTFFPTEKDVDTTVRVVDVPKNKPIIYLAYTGNHYMSVTSYSRRFENGVFQQALQAEVIDAAASQVLLSSNQNRIRFTQEVSPASSTLQHNSDMGFKA